MRFCGRTHTQNRFTTPAQRKNHTPKCWAPTHTHTDTRTLRHTRLRRPHSQYCVVPGGSRAAAIRHRKCPPMLVDSVRSAVTTVRTHTRFARPQDKRAETIYRNSELGAALQFSGACHLPIANLFAFESDTNEPTPQNRCASAKSPRPVPLISSRSARQSVLCMRAYACGVCAQTANEDGPEDMPKMIMRVDETHSRHAPQTRAHTHREGH